MFRVRMKLNSLAPGVNQGIVIILTNIIKIKKTLIKKVQFNWILLFKFEKQRLPPLLNRQKFQECRCEADMPLTRNYKNSPFYFSISVSKRFHTEYFSVLNIYLNMFQILINITRKQTYWEVGGGGFTLRIIVRI